MHEESLRTGRVARGESEWRGKRAQWATGLAVLLVLALPLLVLAAPGDFAPHPATPAFGGGRSSDVALGDLDGDSDLDAVVANYFNEETLTSEPETVWLNDGNGNFTAHPTTPEFGPGSSNAVALGDLDGDGDLDAVVVNYFNEPTTIWLNDGAGNFIAHPTTPGIPGTLGQGVALGDLDGDTDLDVLVANLGANEETVWLNDGAGNFTAHPTTPEFEGGSSTDVALSDLDGDGDLDAVVANYDDEPETVWLNDGAGNFTAHPTTPEFGLDSSYAVALGDLDGDTDIDAVVANLLNAEAETVWLNDGDGNFTAHPTTPEFGTGFSFDVALSDLDGDADLDAVVGNSEAETVWLNDGAGNFTAHPTTPSFDGGFNSYGVALGDLDGDVDRDAVVANYTDFEGSVPETVWLNDGTQEVPTAVTVTGLEAGSGRAGGAWLAVAGGLLALGGYGMVRRARSTRV